MRSFSAIAYGVNMSLGQSHPATRSAAQAVQVIEEGQVESAMPAAHQLASASYAQPVHRGLSFLARVPCEMRADTSAAMPLHSRPVATDVWSNPQPAHRSSCRNFARTL